MARHCIRHPELLACDLVTYESEAERGAKRGRPMLSYLSTLIRDVGTKNKRGTANPDKGEGLRAGGGYLLYILNLLK